jgi:hypothetical protein
MQGPSLVPDEKYEDDEMPVMEPDWDLNLIIDYL